MREEGRIIETTGKKKAAIDANNQRAKEAKEVYERCKEEAKMCVQDTLHVHNKRVTKEISEAKKRKVHTNI